MRLLVVNFTARADVQHGDCRFGFGEQNPEAADAKALCGAAGKLNDVVCQGIRVRGVLIDLLSDLFLAISVA